MLRMICLARLLWQALWVTHVEHEACFMSYDRIVLLRIVNLFFHSYSLFAFE